MYHLFAAAAAGFAVSLIATFILGLLLLYMNTRRFRVSEVVKGSKRIPASELKWTVSGAVAVMILTSGLAGYGASGGLAAGAAAGLAGALPLVLAGLMDVISTAAKEAASGTDAATPNRKARRAASASGNG